jgi:hypothetical protein
MLLVVECTVRLACARDEDDLTALHNEQSTQQHDAD